MKHFKKILLACILTLSVLALTACGKQKTELDDQEQLNLEMTAAQMAYNIISLEDEQIDMLIDQYEYEQNVPLANGFNSWKSAKKELGEFIGFAGAGTTKIESDGSYTMILPLEFENRNCEFVMGLKGRALQDTGDLIKYINQLTFNPEYTMGEKLGQAGTNLLIGMGTVFVVLIFLAWVISLFKYVNKAEQKIEEKKKAKAAVKTADTPAQAEAAPAVKASPAVTVTPAPASDAELQAVIAAAIAAYEEDEGCSIEKQPSLNNGIVVKSFKRG